MMLIRVVGLRILWCCLPLSWLHLMLVSLSPVPALAQPLGQAKVATIFSLKHTASGTFSLTKNQIKGGISERTVQHKS